jgi:hypothetical protein
MKKMLLLIVATITIVFANAQIQFGLKANYNLAGVMQSGPEPQNGLKSKSAFSGGALALIPISAPFYLQPEIVYSAQGTDISDNGFSGSLNYNYLNIPILGKYQSDMGLFGETGPQVGFLLSANAKGEGQTVDMKSQTQSVDFSWAFGVGYKLHDMGLGFDIRYNLGLTNTLKDGGGESVKNSVFQFGVFYLFDTGK